jgi:hypothetical protein
MNNIFYKLFYIIYANVLKSLNYEVEDSFPFVSIIIISGLINLNFLVILFVLFDYVFQIEFRNLLLY